LTNALLVACPCSFLLSDKSGANSAKSEAELTLDKETLSIMPRFGEPVYIPLIDISEIILGEYLVQIGIISGEKLAIQDLAYKFGDFVSNLNSARNEEIVKHLLMNESVKKLPVRGEVTLIEPSGVVKHHESCEIRLYETSLVLMPSDAEPLRLHFSNLGQIDARDFSIVITTDSTEKAIISKLGSEYDNLARDLSDAINTLNIRTQAFLKEISASSSPTAIRTLSRMMKDGKAASSANIKSVSPTLWIDFEKKIEQTQIWQEYNHLKSFARQDLIAVGVKRGLMGDITGSYLWLVLPIYGNNDGYGNAIALESVRLPSTEHKDEDPDQTIELNTGGNATYFFRIADSDEYARLSTNIEKLDAQVDGFIGKLNRLMLDINFRREPIFLSEEKIYNDRQYAKYRYAAQKISSLRELRKLFIGRVIHSSFEQWKSDVADLLTFNKTAPDGARWEKS
jgi:hypothetical protein